MISSGNVSPFPIFFTRKSNEIDGFQVNACESAKLRGISPILVKFQFLPGSQRTPPCGWKRRDARFREIQGDFARI